MFVLNKLHCLNAPLLSCAQVLDVVVIFNLEQNIYFGKCSDP